MPIRAILRSFAHRNFRLFFAGQGLSLIGTWIHLTALPWLVYRTTGSAQWLAIVSFAGQFPAILATPIAGVYADRVNRRRLLLVTQALSMIQALGLAAVALSGNPEVWVLVTLNVTLSIVNAFDLTGRQSFLQEMVERKEDLGNAIALNSSIFNSARLIGPAIAGQLIPLIGEGGCFLMNGLSFLAVLLALLAMKVAPRPAPDRSEPVWRGLRDGLRYAMASAPILCVFGLVALTSLLGVPYNVILPVIVRDRLGGDERLFGWLLAAVGLGALTGALFLASRRSVLGLLRGIGLAPVTAGVCLLTLAWVRSPWVVAILAYFIGLSVVMTLTTCNTVLQTIVADQFRGRILSLYALIFMGVAPVGGLLAGFLITHVSLTRTLQLFGGTLIILALAFTLLVARRWRRQVADLIRKQCQNPVTS